MNLGSDILTWVHVKCHGKCTHWSMKLQGKLCNVIYPVYIEKHKNLTKSKQKVYKAVERFECWFSRSHSLSIQGIYLVWVFVTDKTC